MVSSGGVLKQAKPQSAHDPATLFGNPGVTFCLALAHYVEGGRWHLSSMSYELKNFRTQVRQRSKEIPVLVDFWAPWCGPCRTLGPVLERMATQANGQWELVKVNTEEHQDLAAEYNIASIPAVKLFVGGEVKDEFVGALSEREIRRFLEGALPPPHAKQLAEAKRLLNAGMKEAAAKILEPLVAADATNLEARVLLAEALLGAEPGRALTLVEALRPDSEFAEMAEAVRTLARLSQLANQPGALAEAKVREQYLEGAKAVRAGDLGAALSAFINVLERSKEYDSGGAKAACKAIFQLLGMRHPLVERSFRAFSSALHS